MGIAMIYAMGVYGFVTVTDEYWKSLVWPVYLGKMAADRYMIK